MKKKPHLSVVATSRNDSHGGNSLYRTRHFVKGLIEQSNRHRMATELILVDWNPPEDKPPLSKVIDLPEKNEYCQVRFITVPQEMHAEIENGDKFPLFQMIGKNVGIRRARGDFILATNIDILFSDSLMRYMKNKLRPNVSYRVDRMDVPEVLPDTSSFDEILKFCRHNLVCANTSFGSLFPKGASHEASWLSQMAQKIRSKSFYHLVRKIRLEKLYQAVQKIRSKSLCQIVQKIRSKMDRMVQKVRSKKLFIFGKNFFSQTRKKIFYTLARYSIFQTKAQRLYKKILLPLAKHRVPFHTNASGDFALFSKQDWDALRGYPEWPLFSWNLDGLLLYQAKQLGIRQRILPHPIYHINHGNGFLVADPNQMFERLKTQRIPYVDRDKLQELKKELEKPNATLVYNDENWGMKGKELFEE